ncbi:hypothetical protein RIB2604_02004310 [Aspergillus luchuensis]|uniref:SNF2 N-terminal domain-containing protein n=1 Tax=Aspergillus kawachii TaxID=1069201 RepID=A0A146FKG8_ASPKA|nr:hypothetical protein RIB2604_02004310 [Aspergillus luchuensis]
MRSASSWPRDLSGIFGTLVIDEAHTLRNRNTAQWTAAHAINAKSTTLATATPLFNSFKDFGALYPSLIPSSNESTRYYVDPKLNPFLIQFFYFMMYRCRKTDSTPAYPTSHLGPLENPSKANIGFEEKGPGKSELGLCISLAYADRYSALKHWVLYLGWQQARYLHEPKNKISHESPIWRYAQACEELAVRFCDPTGPAITGRSGLLLSF